MCIINTKITFQEQQHQLEIRWETALRMWAWVQITWIFQRSIEGTNQPIIIYGWGLQSCILVWTEMQHWIQMLQEWWAPPFFFQIYTADWEEKTPIPARYVTQCALSVNGNTQVLLAMSKLDGVPLDQWPLGSCWLIWEYGDGHHGHMLS